MSLGSGVAIYFIVWWVCLLVMLPFGVRNAHEAGETVLPGNEAGAPVKPMLWRKLAATTVLAGAIFLLIYGQVTQGWIGFDDIPFLKDMPRG